MDFNKLANPSEVAKIIRHYQFRFKKRFGQNFLVDKNILHKIITEAQLQPDQYVMEIGAGLGTLTDVLARHCKQVVTFEIDRDLIRIFQENTHPKNIHLIATDALKTDWRQALVECGWDGERVSLIANLPYYITSPLIMKALEGNVNFDCLTLTVQKEVATRIKAKPGTKAYGILTVIIGYYAEVKIITSAPRTVFMPIPDVDSVVIKIKPYHEQQRKVQVDKDKLFTIVKAAFSKRRKTLKNALTSICRQWGISAPEFEQILAELGLSNHIRGEALSLAEFGRLTKKLIEKSG